jgi:hypothetical protein
MSAPTSSLRLAVMAAVEELEQLCSAACLGGLETPLEQVVARLRTGLAAVELHRTADPDLAIAAARWRAVRQNVSLFYRYYERDDRFDRHNDQQLDVGAIADAAADQVVKESYR